MNRGLPSLHDKAIKITLTVPLRLILTRICIVVLDTLESIVYADYKAENCTTPCT